MRYNTIGISLTNKCDASCEICCVDSSPFKNTVLDEREIKKYLNEIDTIPEIKIVAFTGGEIFLKYELLLSMLEFVKNKGKQSAVITNGSWATSKSKSNEIVRELKNLGVISATVSYDQYHGEYVNLIQIKNAISAFKESGIPIGIQAVVFNDAQMDSWINKLISKLGDVHIDFVQGLPVGRADSSKWNERLIREQTKSDLYCRKNGTFFIDSDCSIWPCCSPLAQKTDLMLGSIKTQSIKISWMHLQNHLILNLLRRYGFDFFINLIIGSTDIELPNVVTNACELCSILFSPENLPKIINYIRREHSYNYKHAERRKSHDN